MSWETVIGLEIHAQLSTASKIFSGSATRYGAAPNSQANLVDLAYPGVLPVLNREAVRMAVKFGLAIGAQVAPRSVFARKNYFYPDLPKGYQISQYALPLTAKEHALLVFFLRHADQVLSRTRIYEQVWDDRYDGFSNTLEVHVMDLRRKLEAHGPRLIHTLRGRGYLFGARPEEPA